MVRGLTGGWTRSHLTDLGKRQADRTGRRLAEMLRGRSVGFFTSDLDRAAETARIISQSIDIAPMLAPALREQNLGQANDLTTVEASKIALAPTEGPLVDRLWFGGAETWRMMMRRVFEFLAAIDRQFADTAVLVSHAGAGNCVIFWWLRLQPERWPAVQFELDLCSITHLSVGELEGRRLVRLNDVSHLTESHL
jgi:probable phosphoglycerate mutase